MFTHIVHLIIETQTYLIKLPSYQKLNLSGPSTQMQLSSPNKTSSQRHLMESQSPKKHGTPNENQIQQAIQNRVIKDDAKKIIYLPGYLRVKLKNFVKMDLQNLDVELNVTIIFDVLYGDHGSEVIDELKNNLVFHFEKDEGMAVKEVDESERKLQVTVKNDEEAKRMKYTIRRKINAKVYPDVFWTPFQMINSIITISVMSIKTKTLTISFNLMDYKPNNFLKLSYDTAAGFGNYSLAWNFMRTIYTNHRVNSVEYFYDEEGAQKKRNEQVREEERKKEEYIEELKRKPFKTDIQVAFIERYEKEQKEKGKLIWPQLTHETLVKEVDMKNMEMHMRRKEEHHQLIGPVQEFKQYKYANFLIPIYKFPSVQILTIFLPLVLLSIINLGIFFQDYDLHDRIASISVLLIAFVALVPTLRQELPPTNNIVFIQILVYIQTYASVIALAHSLTVMVQKIQLIQQWTDQGNNAEEFPRYNLNLQNPEFLVALVMTCLVNFIIAVLVIIHKVVWEPNYNVKPLIIEEKEKFQPKKWSHEGCRKDLEGQNKWEELMKNK